MPEPAAPERQVDVAAEPPQPFFEAVRSNGWRYALEQLFTRLRLLWRELSTKSPGQRVETRSTGDVAREVLADMEVAEEPAERAVAPPVATAAPEAPPVDVHRFLEKLDHRERDERSRIEALLVTTRSREATLYKWHLASALLTVLLAFSAVGLVFAGVVPVAVASGAVAILPGAGTLLLRRMWRQERSHRDALEERRNEHAELLDAIEFTLSLPDPEERDRRASELAARLQERAFGKQAA